MLAKKALLPMNKNTVYAIFVWKYTDISIFLLNAIK